MKNQTLYLIGGAALLGILAYVLLRPRAAFAQAPGPGIPRLPPPAVIQPTTDSALPPDFHPAYESSGRPVSEFPMYSVVRLAQPIAGRDGPIYKLLKQGTEPGGQDWNDPYTWFGYGPNWELTGTVYADVHTIGRAAPIAEIVDRNNRLLFKPGMSPGLSWYDSEYVR